MFMKHSPLTAQIEISFSSVDRALAYNAKGQESNLIRNIAFLLN
jgi:hypothetical protein